MDKYYIQYIMEFNYNNIHAHYLDWMIEQFRDILFMQGKETFLKSNTQLPNRTGAQVIFSFIIRQANKVSKNL